LPRKHSMYLIFTPNAQWFSTEDGGKEPHRLHDISTFYVSATSSFYNRQVHVPAKQDPPLRGRLPRHTAPARGHRHGVRRSHTATHPRSLSPLFVFPRSRLPAWRWRLQVSSFESFCHDSSSSRSLLPSLALPSESSLSLPRHTALSMSTAMLFAAPPPTPTTPPHTPAFLLAMRPFGNTLLPPLAARAVSHTLLSHILIRIFLSPPLAARHRIRTQDDLGELPQASSTSVARTFVDIVAYDAAHACR
jgi:hypothetical protein